MTDWLTYTFFQHALLGSLLASIACGVVGTYIVARRLVFISGGLTHASFGGIGIGLYTGISPILSAAVFAILSALGVEWLGKRRDMREDSAIAVFWALGMAVGVMFTFLSPDLRRIFRPTFSAHTDHYAGRSDIAGLCGRLAGSFLYPVPPSHCAGGVRS